MLYLGRKNGTHDPNHPEKRTHETKYDIGHAGKVYFGLLLLDGVSVVVVNFVKGLIGPGGTVRRLSCGMRCRLWCGAGCWVESGGWSDGPVVLFVVVIFVGAVVLVGVVVVVIVVVVTVDGLLIFGSDCSTVGQ